MSLSLARCKVALALVLFCLVPFCLCASVVVRQEAGGSSEIQLGTQTPTASICDYEIKIERGGFLVRKKGSQEWKRSAELKDPVAVGLLDGSRKIYVPSRAVKAPKLRHSPDPEYPPDEAHNPGIVTMHIVVDEHGTVRSPTVDASSSPKFGKAAINAVKEWTFEPSKLNGQPVATLIFITVNFRVP